MMLLTLTFTLWCNTTIHTAHWQNPVLYGTQPVYHQGVLYIFDRLDSRLKAYEIKDEFANVSLLWSAAGSGKGPEEVPATSKFVSLAINAPNETIWLNHQYGHLIFSLNGDFIRHISRKKGDVWAVPNGPYLGVSAARPLFDSKLLTKVRRGQREPLWSVEQPYPLSISEDGHVLVRRPEIYAFKGHYLVLDFSTGMVAILGSNGVFEWVVRTKQTLPETLRAHDFAGSESKMSLKRTGFMKLETSDINRGRSGFTFFKGDLTVQTFHFCIGVRFPEDELYFDLGDKRRLVAKFLTVLNAETGEKKAWYYHPDLTEDLYLFHENKTGWFLFDEENGDRIVIVNRQQVRPIVFALN